MDTNELIKKILDFIEKESKLQINSFNCNEYDDGLEVGYRAALVNIKQIIEKSKWQKPHSN